MTDDLEIFVDAQEDDYPDALGEIRAGKKTSHWIWYVFPQLRGLGRSARSELFGIEGAAEAQAYLSHPVLGPRLVEISTALRDHKGITAQQILGEVDAKKVQSSMTLFAAQPGADPIFAEVLATFYDGQPCGLTTEMLAAEAR